MITKIKTGIKLLIFYYFFIIFQHLAMRDKFKMNALLEAVFLGTLVYLIVGFLQKRNAARIMGMGFHAVLQVLETATVFVFMNGRTLGELMKDIPAEMVPTAKVSFAVVFALITFINVAAIVYLARNGEYFARAGLEEPGPFSSPE
ncbi:MAG: hypothetical protein ACM3OC_02745 [Deltaproteobacteria bacterium]